MKKKMVALLLGVCMVTTLLAGCGASNSGKSKDSSKAKYKVLIGCSNQSQSFYSWLSNSCKKEIEKNYKDVSCDIFDIAGDPANVQTMIENAESGGYTGMIIDTPDETDYTKALENAKKEGIWTVMVNNSNPDDGVSMHVGLNHYDLGYTVGTQAAKDLVKNANVLIIKATAGNPASDDRAKGFVDAIKKEGRSDVKILKEQSSTDWQKENAMAVMEDWTQVYKENQVDAVYSVCDDMVCGAIEVCDAAKWDTKRIQFYGIDGLANGCMAIEQGTMQATVLQNCDDIASTGVKSLYEMMTGTNTKSGQQLLKPLTITKDNVQDIIDMHKSNGMMK